MFSFITNLSTILSVFLVDTVNDTESFSECKLKLKFEVMPVA